MLSGWWGKANLGLVNVKGTYTVPLLTDVHQDIIRVWVYFKKTENLTKPESTNSPALFCMHSPSRSTVPFLGVSYAVYQKIPLVVPQLFFSFT